MARVMHLEMASLLPMTLCGKSTHSWQAITGNVPLHTTDSNKVTCKACLKRMGR